MKSKIPDNQQFTGIHAVLVPIRDKELNVLPNVLVEEMGYKMGLNGVDNAKLTFDNVRGEKFEFDRVL